MVREMAVRIEELARRDVCAKRRKDVRRIETAGTVACIHADLHAGERLIAFRAAGSRKDEFAQVRTFFQQSGFDYLLKPVNPEDIQPVLERLYRKLSCKKGAGNAE